MNNSLTGDIARLHLKILCASNTPISVQQLLVRPISCSSPLVQKMAPLVKYFKAHNAMFISEAMSTFTFTLILVAYSDRMNDFYNSLHLNLYQQNQSLQ